MWKWEMHVHYVDAFQEIIWLWSILIMSTNKNETNLTTHVFSDGVVIDVF